jgi:hypothetical protein
VTGWVLLAALAGVPAAAAETGPSDAAGRPGPLFIYTLGREATPAGYDEALAVACIQGIVNRAGPDLYVVSPRNPRPQYWLDLLSKQGRWLERRERRPLADLDALVAFAGSRVKGAVIWDPAVPASVNVATTMAGAVDAVAVSPEFADPHLARWRLRVLKDLRGQFTGAVTGSSKNDAYRWAIREYLAANACSPHLLCLFEDAYATRAAGNVGYVITRDWAVQNRAFVFDLSPWGDERPGDDPGQKPGLDLETYQAILAQTLRNARGEQMTELTGFFAFGKYSNVPGHKSGHEPVPTEWETVRLISPYNVYQNTISSDCYNQSLHSQAPRAPLRQRAADPPVKLEKKAYICLLMADYDSATPLYDFLPKFWDDRKRGELPLAWGINPNLIETYPDLVAYFYSTATPADTFTADASAAGYTNPNRISREFLPLFARHNRRFFREADMTIAPMVLDQDQPSADVKDAFLEFAPDGLATIVMDMHGTGGRPPQPHVWKGMPVMELLNHACNAAGRVEETADIFAKTIRDRGNQRPGFYLFRVVWVSPTAMAEAFAALRKRRPDLDFEVVGPRTFFSLFKQSQAPPAGAR